MPSFECWLAGETVAEWLATPLEAILKNEEVIMRLNRAW